MAKAKWKNLKDKFRIELKSIPECRSGSEEQGGYKGKWPFFNQMMFTKDVIMPNNTQGNLNDCVSATETSDTETDTDVTLMSPMSPNINSPANLQNSEATCSRSSSRNTNTPVHPRKKKRPKKLKLTLT